MAGLEFFDPDRNPVTHKKVQIYIQILDIVSVYAPENYYKQACWAHLKKEIKFGAGSEEKRSEPNMAEC